MIIIFGGLSPAVLAMRVKYWMLKKSHKYDQFYIHETGITKKSLGLDICMFVIGLAGFALITTAFSETFMQDNKDNLIAVCFCLISAICIGLGLAEIRILCKFKEIRASEKQ